MRDISPAPAPRFLCDEMLGHLARYLRAAGYDVVLASGGVADGQLLEQAQREGRLFLTCDRGVGEHRLGRELAVILRHGPLASLARQLAWVIPIDWQAAPFTRCLVDNGQLRQATAEERLGLPEDLSGQEVRFCPVCRRRYWFGDHCRRLSATLAAWQMARDVQAKPGSQPERG